MQNKSDRTALILAFMVLFIGCTVIVSLNRTEPVDTRRGTPSIARDSVPGDPNPDALDVYKDGRPDVRIKDCWLGDPLDIGETVLVADLSVKNSSSKVSDYWIEVEGQDAAGNRIDRVIGMATNVAPGQQVDTGKGDGDEDGRGTRHIDHTLDKCKIISADRTISTD